MKDSTQYEVGEVMKNTIVALLSILIFCSLALAQQKQMPVDKIDEMQFANTMIGFTYKIVQEKYDKCLKAFGDDLFCECLRVNLPALVTFQDYITIVTSTKEELQYQDLNDAAKKAVDKTYNVIEICVNKKANQTSEDKYKGYSTSGFHNGLLWLAQSEGAKVAYVAGIYDGGRLLWRVLDQSKICTSENFDKKFDSTFIVKTPPKEIAQQIDSFYSDSSNLTIPIFLAYEIAGLKFRGESPSKIEEYTAAMRKFYNNLTEK